MSAQEQHKLVQVRPARAEDFALAQAISERSWEDDYIPKVWEKWLADPDGAFVVATIEERVVGLAKLTRKGPAEWWFEGLRVDPAYRQRGVARAMSDHLVARFRALGGGLARWATGSYNLAVHKLASAQGFERQAVFVPYEAESQSLDAGEFRVLSTGDAALVWEHVNHSPYFEANARSYAVGWTWHLLTEARLAALLDMGLVYGWFGDPRTSPEALDGVVIVCEPDTDRQGDSRLRIAYLDVADADNLVNVAQGMRAVAGRLGVSKVQVKLPEHLARLEPAGYRRTWEHQIWLYALDER